MSFDRVQNSFYDPDDGSLEVVTVEGVQGKVAGGGSAPSGTLVAAEGQAASADDQTTITFDGTPVTVSCITAGPPGWMDDAGNIIAPGLYQQALVMDGGTQPTTPGLYLATEGPYSEDVIAVDALQGREIVVQDGLTTVGEGDLPANTNWTITPPTDATGTAIVGVSVHQLATLTT